MLYIIKPCGPEELPAVLALHQKTFEPLAGEKYTHSKTKFLENIEAGRVLVAASSSDDSNSEVLAFAGYKPLAADPKVKMEIDHWIKWSQYKDNEEKLLEHMSQARQRFGVGEVIAEIYENDYMRACPLLQPEDVYLSEIAVREDQRCQGLGEALTRRRIELARQEGASAIYASCWEGGHQSKLLEKLGFLPLMRVGPRYADSQAEKVMCLWLK